MRTLENTTTSPEQEKAALQVQLIQQQALIAQLTETSKLLAQQVEWLKKQLFGRKSERFVDQDQPDLPGFEAEQQKVEEEKITVPTHEKRKAKSTPFNQITYPEDLPVEREVLDLSEEEKIDAETGKPLVYIGEEVTRKLAKRAASYFVKEIARKKYAVQGKAEEGIKAPELPDTLINRCAVDEGFLADIIVGKFCDHLPLYRQSEMLTRGHIYISRQTLSSYVSKIGHALTPLYNLLEEEIKVSGNLFIDETPVDVLAPGTGKTRQGYMTVMAGGSSLDPPLRIYRFFPDRKHEHFAELFGSYKGVFHSDKYEAYAKQAKDPDKVWCPCYSHIRRKYFEAEGGDATFREEVLSDIRKLFAIEERYKQAGPEERVKARIQEAGPIIDELVRKNKAKLQDGRLLPKSKLAGAIGYFLGLVPYLKNYLHHPYARLDNNVAERALKLVVIGRKNWLFVGGEGGGNASAVIYSLAQTCRALKINPREYFEDLFRRFQGHPYSRLSELLPHNWKRQ